MLQQSDKPILALTLMIVIGLLMSGLWFWVQRRALSLLSSLEKSLKENDPLYKRHISSGPVSQTRIMSFVPLGMLVIWLILGANVALMR